tara:strand:+ start:205 stop:378 length:174 start_codon:yes stop_codon:yes gene_type:complete
MIEQIITTKLQRLLDGTDITKAFLADEIGISRTTLDSRLKLSNWKKSEVTLIKAKFL